MTTMEDSEQSPVSPDQNDDIVLAVEGVSKKFCRSLKRSLFYGLKDIAHELLGSPQQARDLRAGEFWALKDISLKLRRGEALGLVGVNGSGKTTLLRIISGLIRPDTGIVTVKGQVAPLIALGAGFNPVLTGRENIYANMSILGLSTREINERFEDVINFAEIGDAIDAPVLSYSSGMTARLGFACAIHTEPDILLIDEVLSVGDIRFRLKCDRKLAELRQKGTSFIVVSHFFQAILNTCTSAAYLSDGHIVMQGDARSVVDQYEQDLSQKTSGQRALPLFLPEKNILDSAGADITGVYFKDAEGKVIETPESGQGVYFCVSCHVHQYIPKLGFFLSIYHPKRENSLMLHISHEYDEQTFEVSPGNYELQAYFPYLALLPGSYFLNIALRNGTLYSLDAYESLVFDVVSMEKVNRGVLYQKRKWQIVNQP